MAAAGGGAGGALGAGKAVGLTILVFRLASQSSRKDEPDGAALGLAGGAELPAGVGAGDENGLAGGYPGRGGKELLPAAPKGLGVPKLGRLGGRPACPGGKPP